jgi:Mn-containing catalase
MWVKFVLLIQFLILSTTSSLRIDNNGVSGVVSLEDDSEVTNDLPNIWEDELVNRMVREMLARDLFHEHEHRRARRQYKRDIHSSASPETSEATVIARAATKTTRKSSATSKTKKPSKVTQTGNKNKNRATTTAATRATKATVKPSSRPIVSTTANFGSVNGSSKIKVRIFSSQLLHTCSHNERP